MNATTIFIAAYLAAFLFAVIAAAYQVWIADNEISRQVNEVEPNFES